YAPCGLLFLCLLANMTVIASPTPTPLTILITSKLEPDDPPSSQRASYLQQPPKAKAVEGEDVVFPCFLQSDVDEVQAVEKVRWYVQSLEGRKNVLQGNKTVEEEFAGRVFLSGDLSEGDLSMTLRNISVEDQGLYLCSFISTHSTVLQGGGTKLNFHFGVEYPFKGYKAMVYNESTNMDITLDLMTNHPWLQLSDDKRKVQEALNETEVSFSTQRFDSWPCVLGWEGLTSGRYYWEIYTANNGYWRIGVTNASSKRHGRCPMNPSEGFWTIWRSTRQFYACTKPEIELPLSLVPKKLGVYLDYEEGQVSFYKVETRSHIFTFITNFR
uniref:Si:ch211-114c12.5 n=1 Tax=Cyprinus carpio TaxID=7962 RepID=A0A8C1L3K5_CYPCA